MHSKTRQLTLAAQIPGLAAEGVVGILLFYVIAAALEAAGLTKFFQISE